MRRKGGLIGRFLVSDKDDAGFSILRLIYLSTLVLVKNLPIVRDGEIRGIWTGENFIRFRIFRIWVSRMLLVFRRFCFGLPFYLALSPAPQLRSLLWVVDLYFSAACCIFFSFTPGFIHPLPILPLHFFRPSWLPVSYPRTYSIPHIINSIMHIFRPITHNLFLVLFLHR